MDKIEQAREALTRILDRGYISESIDEEREDYLFAREALARLSPSTPVDGVRAESVAWRCFYCDDTFTSEHDARKHFGPDEASIPACQIKGSEGGLVEALRRAERDAADAWSAIHNETTDAAKAYHAQASRHNEQLRHVEQLGYDRGIADAKAHPETLGLSALANPEAEARLRERVAELERERDEARLLVIEANNSLYGSQGYFHSTNGGAFDKHHLSRPIEELKERARRAVELERERDYAVSEMKTARAYKNIEAAHAIDAENRAEAAEARLAQAEGGPAVTEAKRFPEVGDKMRFLDRNGYKLERERAATIFDMSRAYTVKAVSIGGWSTSIQFEEVEGHWNSVMFAEAALHPQSAAGEEGK